MTKNWITYSDLVRPDAEAYLYLVVHKHTKKQYVGIKKAKGLDRYKTSHKEINQDDRKNYYWIILYSGDWASVRYLEAKLIMTYDLIYHQDSYNSAVSYRCFGNPPKNLNHDIIRRVDLDYRSALAEYSQDLDQL